MPGRSSRSKGLRAEREAAALLPGGRRVPLSGGMGGEWSCDLLDRDGRRYEVKVRADGFRQIYDWLEVLPGHGVGKVRRSQAAEQGSKAAPDVLLLRADNSPWLAVMLLSDWVSVITNTKTETAEE